MSRFKQTKDPRGNTALEALYKEILEAGAEGSEPGVPNNLVTSLSERPDLLAPTWELFKGVVVGGVVPSTVKEMILMAIAMQNDCQYCSVAHTRALEAMGVPTEVIQSCTSDPELAQVPPLQRAMIKFGLKTARDPKSVTDDDFQTLRDHGLSDGEIMEVTMLAAAGNFLDTWAHVSGIQVD
ncbi:MAG TPA: carboxymuconolactone decarboxylase family protein [Vicinamibacteria bacterium]|nr:carboxymuconolactone decarboxylase family protein [Vicinamibacteria bacterium]